MRKSRLSVAVPYLVVGMWLGFFSLDGATAQIPSLILPLLLAQSQQEGSNTPRPNTASQTTKFESSFSLSPIAPACPFPPLPMSRAAAKSLFGFGLSGDITLNPVKPTFSTAVPTDERSAVPTDERFAATVSDLVRAGKLGQALQVAQKIKDVSLKNEALRSIASAYKSAGQLNQAFQVAKSIIEPSQSNISLRDNALLEIVQAYAQAGQLDQALQVAEIMGEGFKFSTLLDIAEKYRLARQPVRAASIIERADAVYRTLSKPNSTNLLANPSFKIFILPRLIGKYAAVGRKQKAVELSSELFEFIKTLPQQNYMTLTNLSGIAEIYQGAGQSDKAAEVLDYSLLAVKNIKEVFVKAQALAQIANEYALLKQSVRASEVLSQALALAKPDKEVSSKNIVMITVARGYGVLGQYDKALEITKAVEPVSLRDQVKQTITCSKGAK